MILTFVAALDNGGDVFMMKEIERLLTNQIVFVVTK